MECLQSAVTSLDEQLIKQVCEHLSLEDCPGSCLRCVTQAINVVISDDALLSCYELAETVIHQDVSLADAVGLVNALSLKLAMAPRVREDTVILIIRTLQLHRDVVEHTMSPPELAAIVELAQPRTSPNAAHLALMWATQWHLRHDLATMLSVTESLCRASMVCHPSTMLFVVRTILENCREEEHRRYREACFKVINEFPDKSAHLLETVIYEGGLEEKDLFAIHTEAMWSLRVTYPDRYDDITELMTCG